MAAPPRLSIEEIDKLIKDLDNAMDASAASDDNEDTSRTESTALPFGSNKEQDRQALHLELPSEIWEDFQEYCKQNELDPAQQISEAVASYYKNLLQTYRIRIHMNSYDESSLA